MEIFAIGGLELRWEYRESRPDCRKMVRTFTLKIYSMREDNEGS